MKQISRLHRKQKCHISERWHQTLGIQEDELELYGKYKAKLSDEVWNNVKDRPDGKLVLVTAINPTPAGEGKTTTTRRTWTGYGKIK